MKSRGKIAAITVMFFLPIMLYSAVCEKEWQDVGLPGFTEGAGYFSSLFVYDGIPYAAYADVEHENRLSVMKYSGTSWEYVGAPGFTGGRAAFISLYVYNGMEYVSFYNADANTVSYTHLTLPTKRIV